MWDFVFVDWDSQLVVVEFIDDFVCMVEASLVFHLYPTVAGGPTRQGERQEL